MKYLDKEIDLFGDKWQIKYVDEISDEGDNKLYGTTDYGTHIIHIATKVEGKPLEKEAIRITLLHELNHAILQAGQYCEISTDEPLVEWIAKCYNYLIKNKVL